MILLNNKFGILTKVLVFDRPDKGALLDAVLFRLRDKEREEKYEMRNSINGDGANEMVL